MPFLIVIAAGYQAYAASEKAKEAAYDPDINLEGKTAITLLKMEQQLSSMEMPLSSVTFFDGNYKDVVPYLKSRVKKIEDKNKWLTGWLIKDKYDHLNLKIFYDETGSDGNKGTFEAYEPYHVPLMRDPSQYMHFARKLIAVGAMIPGNAHLIGKNRPFWKVSVIPDTEKPDERFALVISLSHAVADIYTYYQLFHMLDREAIVDSLDPKRVVDTDGAVEKKLGEREANYFYDAMSEPPIDLTETRDEPTVFKIFYVDEDWLMRMKENRSRRRSSFFDPDSMTPKPMTSMVSANSIISSWFFKANEASVGLIMVNLRNRVDFYNVGSSHAGNYVHPLVYTPDDYNTPSLIQESVANLRRCGPYALAELPSFRWNMTTSVSTNWANFYRDEIDIDDNVKSQLHLPLYDLNALKMVPSRVSMVNIFSAFPTGVDGSERRAGAIVMCRKSVWEANIKDCGIVDEIIFDI
jgi:hypothetical protein